MTAKEARPWRMPLLSAAAGGAAYGVARLLMAVPGAAERWYATGIGPALTRPLSRATGILPVSVGEWLLICYAAFLLFLAVRGVRRAARERAWRGAAGAGVRRVLRDGGVIVLLFYVLWGFNYARPPLETRLGWPSWEGVETDELVALARVSLDRANEAYLALHGREDTGAPTRVTDPAALEAAIDGGWREAAARLALNGPAGEPFGRVKRPLLSEGLARLGITGIYIPFTAEANVVRGLPAVALPATMGHEKAHQRGVSSEAEASFLGWLAAAAAEDPLARYSAAVFAHRQILGALVPATPDSARAIAGGRLPGVRRDLMDLAEYVNRYRGVARDIGTAVNDRYLRANRVPGGVRNYGHAVRLLITWSRLNGAPGP